MRKLATIDWGEWFPKILGGLMLIFTVIFWAFTDRVEPLFVTTGGGLLAIGQGAKALGELRRPPEPPDREAT
jgi:hypothetical protein